jgi:hypothetical protein
MGGGGHYIGDCTPRVKWSRQNLKLDKPSFKLEMGQFRKVKISPSAWLILDNSIESGRNNNDQGKLWVKNLVEVQMPVIMHTSDIIRGVNTVGKFPIRINQHYRDGL